MKLSCIICAYNEAPRIAAVLSAVAGHPLIHEVIVVDDASTDGTADIVQSHPGVTLVELKKNGGKSRALAHGLTAARGDTVMLLDADLFNLSPQDVSALAEPVVHGAADVSLSLRKNAFAIHHWLGLDFTSGERVISKHLLEETLREVGRLPRFGIESYMNSLIIQHGLRLAVVPWRSVEHMRKSQKYGFIRGTLADLGMALDVLRVLSPWQIIQQHYRLLKLCQRTGTKFPTNASADASQE